MTCHKYHAINAEGKVLKVIKIGTRKDIAIASAKVKALYKDMACFVGLVYAGTWELGQ